MSLHVSDQAVHLPVSAPMQLGPWELPNRKMYFRAVLAAIAFLSLVAHASGEPAAHGLFLVLCCGLFIISAPNSVVAEAGDSPCMHCQCLDDVAPIQCRPRRPRTGATGLLIISHVLKFFSQI